MECMAVGCRCDDLAAIRSQKVRRLRRIHEVRRARAAVPRVTRPILPRALHAPRPNSDGRRRARPDPIAGTAHICAGARRALSSTIRATGSVRRGSPSLPLRADRRCSGTKWAYADYLRWARPSVLVATSIAHFPSGTGKHTAAECLDRRAGTLPGSSTRCRRRRHASAWSNSQWSGQRRQGALWRVPRASDAAPAAEEARRRVRPRPHRPTALQHAVRWSMPS